jgi:hypothetical protein
MNRFPGAVEGATGYRHEQTAKRQHADRKAGPAKGAIFHGLILPLLYLNYHFTSAVVVQAPMRGPRLFGRYQLRVASIQGACLDSRKSTFHQ